MRFTKLSVGLLLISTVTLGAATSQPAASQPADGPTVTVRKYFSVINLQDRKGALAWWDTSAPNAAQAAGAQVDMMLALARLKRAVATRWGAVAVYDLHMAVIYPDECGAFTETVNGDTATVTVASNDPESNVTRPADPYSMIHSKGKWLLSVGADVNKNATKEQIQQQQVAAAQLIGLIDQVGKDVQAGRCVDTTDVLKHISEGMQTP